MLKQNKLFYINIKVKQNFLITLKEYNELWESFAKLAKLIYVTDTQEGWVSVLLTNNNIIGKIININWNPLYSKGILRRMGKGKGKLIGFNKLLKKNTILIKFIISPRIYLYSNIKGIKIETLINNDLSIIKSIISKYPILQLNSFYF